MSCRVLKRGMENFVLNTVVEFAKERGYLRLVGEYLPTIKNDLVKYHYQNLGFERVEELWELDVRRYSTRRTFIKRKSEQG